MKTDVVQTEFCRVHGREHVLFPGLPRPFSIPVSPAVIFVKFKPLLLWPACATVFPGPLRVRAVF